MREDIVDRIVEEAYYIVETGATVRQTAKIFHFSKSTVHKDVTERLKHIDLDLHKKVKKVLEFNLSERHIRGGLATKKKYSTR
jgi:putative DeoR family transcriptional regulator (stage III sporulation protein D)